MIVQNAGVRSRNHAEFCPTVPAPHNLLGMFNELAFARALHVIGVVIWIGGVAMVTMVILPAVRALEQPERRVDLFEAIEGRFALIARYATVLVGATGFYLLHAMDAWSLFSEPSHWWLHAMVAVWAIFTLVLFVLEPAFLHRWFREQGRQNPERTFRVIQVMHWVLLTMSLITVFGAVAGSHGWYFF